jgi:type III restriction enzyme
MEFQTIKVAELYWELQQARNEFSGGGKRQAVVLSSPTGSGKTLMTTALMERLVYGYDPYPPDPRATFLWITDDPHLNEQSKRKVVDTSRFGWGDVITIDEDFDQAMFDAGKLFFLNTQKLGKDTQWTSRGTRAHTLWDTIANTVAANPAGFLVILDEAHKGMKESKASAAKAQSIVQRFIKGSPGETPPVPLILGMSATPMRFTTLLQGVSGRNRRDVEVDVADVRESGLIKDRVILRHPQDNTPASWSLLQRAAETWAQMRDEWTSYSTAQNLARPVKPVFVVQVEDGDSKVETKTDLAKLLEVVETAMGPLASDQIAHAFQEEHALVVGSRHIRKVSPPDIQGDDRLCLVLFKMSLNTGWDCPRAEVMMSFRRAADYTAIAQLIGRMVRTPLARPVESKTLLNTVSLYLPDYDRKEVTAVIKRLSDPNDDGVGSDVSDEDDILWVERRPDGVEFLDKIASLPCYYASRVPKQPAVRRLVALGRYLDQDGIREGALAEARRIVQKTLAESLGAVADQPLFRAQCAGTETITERSIAVEFGVDETDESTGVVARHLADLEALFAWCGRRLGEGLHLAYIKKVVDENLTVPVAKRELYVLLNYGGVWEKLDSRCLKKVNSWFEQYQPAIEGLSEERRVEYRKVRRTAVLPEPISIRLPDRLVADRTGDRWDRHLYVDSDGTFPCKVSGWERPVLEAELAGPVNTWLRNEPRKQWSFSVTYKDAEGARANMYPDFLMWRETPEGMVVDILEPHRANEGDAPYKIMGLAEYADLHGSRFGRIEVISKVATEFRRLNLNHEEPREAAKRVSRSIGGVAQLFRDFGSSYP